MFDIMLGLIKSFQNYLLAFGWNLVLNLVLRELTHRNGHSKLVLNYAQYLM